MLSHVVLSCCSSLVEEAFGTRVQRIDQVLADLPRMIGALLLPISAKMSRQEEKVISFKIRDVSLETGVTSTSFPSYLGCSLNTVQGQTCISQLVHIQYHKLVPLYPVSLIEISKLCSLLWGFDFLTKWF